jgi:hypothetical protein
MTEGDRSDLHGSHRTPERRTALAEEIARVQHNAHFTANIQFAQAAIWRGIDLSLNIPTAALAAVAGSIALSTSSNSRLVGILALAAAGIVAINTALDSARRQIGARECANSALEVRNAARQLLVVDIDTMEIGSVRDELRNLTSRLDEIHKIADPPSKLAMWQGRRNAQHTLKHLTVRASGESHVGQ